MFGLGVMLVVLCMGNAALRVKVERSRNPPDELVRDLEEGVNVMEEGGMSALSRLLMERKDRAQATKQTVEQNDKFLKSIIESGSNSILVTKRKIHTNTTEAIWSSAPLCQSIVRDQILSGQYWAVGTEYRASRSFRKIVQSERSSEAWVILSDYGEDFVVQIDGVRSEEFLVSKQKLAEEGIEGAEPGDKIVINLSGRGDFSLEKVEDLAEVKVVDDLESIFSKMEDRINGKGYFHTR